MEDNAPKPTLRYMPALDGLRAIAVAGVLAFHGGYLRAGFLGVDLFFVLSGYLITLLLVVEAGARGGIRLGRFWARRARRLLPALLLTLIAVAGYAAWLASPTELARIRADSLATLFYVANWHEVIAEQSYWDLFSVPSPLNHTWSLAIEEQFYLLWPLAVALLFRLARKPRRTLLYGCLVLAVASAGWLALCYVPAGSTSRAYFGTDTRASALLVGAALATWVALRGHTESASRRAAIEWGAAAAIVVLAVAWAGLDGHGAALYWGGLGLCQLAVAAVLASVCHPQPGLIARALSWRPLRFIGKISYGLYLWHWPVFVALSEARLGVGGERLFALRLAVSGALAVASYYAVELPIRHGAFAGWRMALVAPASFAAVAGVSVVSTVSRPIARAEPQRLWMTPSAVADNQRRPFRLMVAGDSVAERLFTYMQPLQQQLGVELSSSAQSGCGLFDGLRRLRLPDGAVHLRGRGCSPLEQRYAEPLEQGRPEAVLLITGAPVRGQWEHEGRWSVPCEPVLDAFFEARAKVAIDALGAKGAQVFVATMPYITDDEYGPEENRRTDCLNRRLGAAAAARTFAAVVDLAGYVCPGGHCQSHLDGVMLRHDGLHFQGEGAERVGWWLVGAIRTALEPGDGIQPAEPCDGAAPKPCDSR